MCVCVCVCVCACECLCVRLEYHVDRLWTLNTKLFSNKYALTESIGPGLDSTMPGLVKFNRCNAD